eukprot:55003-Eustigmatos_ZCMA.PRE.2
MCKWNTIGIGDSGHLRSSRPLSTGHLPIQSLPTTLLTYDVSTRISSRFLRPYIYEPLSLVRRTERMSHIPTRCIGARGYPRPTMHYCYHPHLKIVLKLIMILQVHLVKDSQSEYIVQILCTSVL